MADDYRTLFLNEKSSDVQILVATDEGAWRFPAHCLILCNASEVMCRIVEYLPIRGNGFKDFVISDLTPNSVLNLLQYIYTSQLPVHKWQDIIELLQAACKYRIRELVDECESLIFNQIDINNVCEIAESSQRLQLHSVQSKCLQVLQLQASVVLNSESFLKLGRDNLTALLRSDDLNVTDERTVVTALWKWGKKQCCRLGKDPNEDEIEQVLAELLDHIRVQHIEYEAGLPLCLRVRKNKYGSAAVKTKKGKRKQREICIEGRIYRPAEISNYSKTICLADPRCWEGIREMKESSILCAILSSSHAMYLTGFLIDVVENNACGNILFISINDEHTGTEIARQECCWIDSYERKHVSTKELWHLSLTYLDSPVRLEAWRMYSIRIHSIGVTGDSFPCQSIKQRIQLADECVRLTLHALELVALRKLHFIRIDDNDVWRS